MNANWTTGINEFCEKIVNLAWLNTLWILFTVLGLGIFGWAPATAAMLSVIRKQSSSDAKFPVFKEFFANYKKSFIQANIIGLILILGIGSLFLSISTLLYLEQWIMIILGTVFFMVLILFGIVALFIFPVFTHYNTSFSNYFRYALYIGLSHLPRALLITLSLVIAVALFVVFPNLLLFFAVSAPAKCVMYFSLKIFKTIGENAANSFSINGNMSVQN